MPRGWRRVWPASCSRDPAQMNGLLEKAEFGGQPITEQQARVLVTQGQALLDQANLLLS